MADNRKTKEDLDQEKKYKDNMAFMHMSDEDYQKELDFYGQFPQFKYQQEMFAKQYDDPDKELSTPAKAYSVLHTARNGLEALPAVAGSGIVSTVATPIIAGIMSAAGRPLARVYNGENGKVVTPYISVDGSDKRWTIDEKNKILDDASKLADGKYNYNEAVKNVDQFTKDRPIITKYGSEYNKSLAQPNQGNYAKNLTDIKGTVEDLNDATPPKAGSVTNVGKEFAITKPKFANAISKAIKLAKGLGDAATSYGIGSLITKGDDNYNDTLAKKYTRDFFFNLPTESQDYIKENGLTEDTFNTYVRPYISFNEKKMYDIDEQTLKDMLAKKQYDALYENYGIDTSEYQKSNKKDREALVKHWLSAVKRARAFENK